MKFEHFALNVPDARASVEWYTNHAGLRIARSKPDAPYTTFLSDDTGRVIMEVYTNPAAPVPDYASIHPLCFHVAFVADDPNATRMRLLAAGASSAYEENLPDGSFLIMLRDPWGVPLQLVRRATPFAAP
ncbi:MAG TPA: VOC family protein [Opitutaceae bacterium]|nr:VOC family protein [Opitutaceae bacterium]